MNNNNNNRSGNGAMNEVGLREINFRDIFTTLIRGKWIILIGTLIVFNYFLFKTLGEEPIYEAKTTVFVSSRGQLTPLGFFAGDGGRNIINEIEILKSTSLARNVAQAVMERRFLDEDETEIVPLLINVTEAGEFVSFASLESVARRLQSATSFGQVMGSDIIEVKARSTNPREAAFIADAYAQVYYRQHFEGSRAHKTMTREFLEKQLAERKQALSISEEELKRYQERFGVVNVDADSRRVIEQVARLEANRDELAVQINAKNNTLRAIREQLAQHEPDVARGLTSPDIPYIRQIQQELANLQLQRDRLIVQNPEVVGQEQYQSRLRQLDDQMEHYRQMLERRTNEYVDGLSPGDEGYLRQLKQRIITEEIELQGLNIQKNAIDRSLRDFERQFDQLPQMTMQYARLERAKQSNEQLYLKIEEQYNQAIINEQSEFGSVNVIDNARVPGSPVSPNMPRNLAMGFILGFGLSTGLVFLKEVLSTKIRTPEDIKKENLTNLATIAMMYSEVKRLSKNGWVSTKGRVISGYVITVANPLSPTSEAFRALRTNIQYSQVDTPVKTLIVSSPNPGEGKSTVAANLAVSYANAEKKVLIVDADLRKPTLHTILDLNKKPGLSNILFENIDLTKGIQNTVVDNLYAISCGDIPANPADLLGSTKFRKLFDTLKEQFDIIIFDTPPLMAATDASVLSTLCDGMIIVTSARRTKVEELKVSVESVENVQGRVFGTVLNKFDSRDSYGTTYTMQYYKYGSYGQSSNGHKKKSVFSK